MSLKAMRIGRDQWTVIRRYPGSNDRITSVAGPFGTKEAAEEWILQLQNKHVPKRDWLEDYLS